MKKYTIAAGVGALALLLAGCGQPSIDEPATYVAPAEDTYDTDTRGASDEVVGIYLSMMREDYPELVPIEDEILIGAGVGACEMFDEGLSLPTVLALSIDALGESSYLASAVVGYGAAAFCPEYSYQFER